MSMKCIKQTNGFYETSAYAKTNRYDSCWTLMISIAFQYEYSLLSKYNFNVNKILFVGFQRKLFSIHFKNTFCVSLFIFIFLKKKKTTLQCSFSLQ